MNFEQAAHAISYVKNNSKFGATSSTTTLTPQQLVSLLIDCDWFITLDLIGMSK
jgi:hypothetical protein